jgi:hypothetical protein
LESERQESEGEQDRAQHEDLRGAWALLKSRYGLGAGRGGWMRTVSEVYGSRVWVG